MEHTRVHIQKGKVSSIFSDCFFVQPLQAFQAENLVAFQKGVGDVETHM